MIAGRGLLVQGQHEGLVRRLSFLMVALGVIAGAVRAEESSAQRADRLKARYLLNFMKFVEWPAPAQENLLTVCFIGGQGVLNALASGIENKVVGERHLTVRMLSDSEAPAGCDVLYLDAATFVTGEILHVDGGQAAGR